MDQFTRFAVYYAPRPGTFADATAAWLGWDAQAGHTVAQPDTGLPDLAALTAAPRRYGFHGTFKAPFRLAPGTTVPQLILACDALAANLAPVTLDRLHLGLIDGFLALTPTGETRTLNVVAADVVETLEPFRAPLTEADIARRRPDSLTPRQRRNLMIFGYPYVLDDFQFHLTLTGPLAADDAERVSEAAQRMLAPHIADHFQVQDLCLFGENAATTRFHLLHRAPLAV
jgi:putative phosphonate metabolism protein